jgi:hypothetical protein
MPLAVQRFCINHTHERLTALGLAGMAKAFDDQQRQPDEDKVAQRAIAMVLEAVYEQD